jgi:RNA polymerase sigma-70 factor (ECF subfamily)
MLRLENLTEVHPCTLRDFPGQDLQQREQRAYIERAFASLSRVQREALYMREFEDLSHDEIARALNLNLNTVKSRIHSARRAMMRELADIKSVLIGSVPDEESWHEHAG